MKQKLLKQLASAAKILKSKDGYAESTLKRAASLILNNKTKADNSAVRMATKIRETLASTTNKTKPVNNPNKNANLQSRLNFDFRGNSYISDKLTLLNSFNNFRRRLMLFDLITGTFRNSWWAKPLLVAYLIISYLFSVYVLARLTFLIEVLQLDFWGILDRIKNLDLYEIEGLFKDWNPVPYDPNAPNIGLSKVPVEDNPFAGTYVKQIDPKDFAIEQYKLFKQLTNKVVDGLAKSTGSAYDMIGKASYSNALQGLNDAYYNAINTYGSLSDFRRALGLYTGIKGWFNSWIGYPLYDWTTWVFSGNPLYTIIVFALATAAMSFLSLSSILHGVIAIPVSLLHLPIHAVDWLLGNYLDTFILSWSNKVSHVLLKTGISEAFSGVFSPRDSAPLEQAITEFNSKFVGTPFATDVLNKSPDALFRNTNNNFAIDVDNLVQDSIDTFYLSLHKLAGTGFELNYLESLTFYPPGMRRYCRTQILSIVCGYFRGIYWFFD